VWTDRSAVAGFFEDIPVLLIILVGVMSLVLSGVVAAERAQHIENQKQLDLLASRLIDSVAINVAPDPAVEHASMVAFASLNATRCAANVLDDESFGISVIQLYPSMEWIQTRSPDPQRQDTGYASRLFNARLDDGSIGVLEVVAFVWR
jgi:hypothetical protein